MQFHLWGRPPKPMKAVMKTLDTKTLVTKSAHITILASILLLPACGNDPGFDESTAFRSRGNVQFVNLVPNSPELLIEHATTLPNTPAGLPTLSFGEASSIRTQNVDNYNWRVSYLGANNTAVTVAEGKDAGVKADTRHTFILRGTGVNNVTAEVVEHPAPSILNIAEGKTQVWFAANTDTSAMMDIYLTEHDADLTQVEPLLTLARGAESMMLHTMDAATNRRIRITAATTKTPLLFDSGALNLVARVRYFYAITSSAGNPDTASFVDVVSASTLAASRMPNLARPTMVRVANFTSTNPAVVTLGTSPDTLGLGSIAKAAQTDYMTFGMTGEQSVTVSLPPTNPPTNPAPDPLATFTTTLAASRFNSIYLFDNPTEGADPPMRLIIAQDDIRTIAERTNFRFVSGATELIDLFFTRDGAEIETNTPRLNNVTPSTVVFEIVPGMITFTATDESDSTTVHDTLMETLTAGKSYTLVLDAENNLVLFTDEP